ncbi:hypothetical protein CP533_1457 [Ophiocordyceps camponoti-saundersi (nom. inval.)]|nr:hypothetical protein CP533_1457 [Ophiocordyceps camponoti-saundersi (nom. inval.)]
MKGHQILTSLALWLFFLWPHVFAIDRGGDDQNHLGDDNLEPMEHGLTGNSSSPAGRFFIVLPDIRDGRGRQTPDGFAPSHVRSRGGLWQGVFDQTRGQPSYYLTYNISRYSNIVALRGVSLWVYAVTPSPNTVPLHPDSTTPFYPVGGVPWSQIQSYAYMPPNSIYLDWDNWLHFFRERQVQNDDYNRTWESFGLATHDFAHQGVQVLLRDLNTAQHRRRFMDDITTHGILWARRGGDFVSEERIAQLRALLHWNPANESRSLPVLDPRQNESLRSLAMRSLNLNDLHLTPRLRTSIASGLGSGEDCAAVSVAMDNAEAEKAEEAGEAEEAVEEAEEAVKEQAGGKRRKGKVCSLMRRQESDQCEELFQRVEKCPELLERPGAKSKKDKKKETKKKETKKKETKENVKDAPPTTEPSGGKNNDNGTGKKTKQGPQGSQNDVEKSTSHPDGGDKTAVDDGTKIKENDDGAEPQCRGGHDYRKALGSMSPTELDDIDKLLLQSQRNYAEEHRIVALLSFCAPLFASLSSASSSFSSSVIRSKLRLGKRESPNISFSVEERAMCFNVRGKACVGGGGYEKTKMMMMKQQYIFYASHEWPSAVRQIGGFLPDGEQEQFHLDGDDVFLDFGKAAERAGAHPPKNETRPDQAGVVYYVHVTPNMVLSRDGRGIVVMGGIVWAQIRGWLQIKAGFRPPPPPAASSDKAAALVEDVRKAAKAKLPIMSHNKDYNAKLFDPLSVTYGWPTMFKKMSRDEAKGFMDEKGKPVGWTGDFPLFKRGQVTGPLEPPHEEGFWKEVWHGLERHPVAVSLVTIGLGALGVVAVLVAGPAGAAITLEVTEDMIPLMASAVTA